MGKKTHQNKEHYLREYYSLYYTERITVLSYTTGSACSVFTEDRSRAGGLRYPTSLRALHFVQLADMSSY